VPTFVKKYKAKYGQVPDGLAALGYDSARLLADAMAGRPRSAGKDLAAAIAADQGLPGRDRRITIDETATPRSRRWWCR
jgi:branched-chain amino acid transport system substrate-binding protein